ncbi:MAG: GLPGLI family protein [Chitinophagaceae bacterium]
MKKLFTTALLGLPFLTCFAQQKEGKVVYDRVTKMQIEINGDDNVARNLPQTRTDKFELLFAGDKSLWHISDEQTPDEDNGGGNGGVQIRMIGGGVDDISYYDLGKGLSVEQRDFMEKKFIVNDSINKLKWKLTGESKTILNHNCQQATAQRIGIRMMMNMDNGKMERKEVADTSTVVAWFTSDIPVAAGPAEFQSQLPGLILEMSINNGRQIYTATEISAKADIASIKEPKSGKRVTKAEFKMETQKMMEQMQKNNEGGGRVIRINN